MERDTTLDAAFDAGLTPQAWWKMASRPARRCETAPERIENSPITYDLTAVANARSEALKERAHFSFLG
jgi:hypothetical protein